MDFQTVSFHINLLRMTCLFTHTLQMGEASCNLLTWIMMMSNHTNSLIVFKDVNGAQIGWAHLLALLHSLAF